MPETFLILLCGGIMFATAVPDPRTVILRWLRLGGITALTIGSLSAFFFFRRDYRDPGILASTGATLGLILAQLAFVQLARRTPQRVCAVVAALSAAITGTALLHSILADRAGDAGIPMLAIGTACTAAVLGLGLMDMLLGHAYLNAAEMTMAPFMRLNRTLALALILRAAISAIGTFVLQWMHPMEMFWGLFALYIGTRWFAGILVPGIFVWMTNDCIKRRATQSATGILYVAGVLLFVGEIIGLYLMSETGRPI